jgi:hypothetical protein
VIEATPGEHRGRLRRALSLEELKGVQNGVGPDSEEGVTQPLLGHVQGHLGVEDTDIEVEQPVQVLREKSDVMDAG